MSLPLWASVRTVRLAAIYEPCRGNENDEHDEERGLEAECDFVEIRMVPPWVAADCRGEGEVRIAGKY